MRCSWAGDVACTSLLLLYRTGCLSRSFADDSTSFIPRRVPMMGGDGLFAEKKDDTRAGETVSF